MIYTNKHNLPQSLVDVITKETYDLKVDPQVISITSLISPPKIRQLKLRHSEEIEEDISENIWRLLGSSVHEVLARADHPERLIEERLKEPIDGMIITGRIDLYESKEKIVSDYKVTSVWSVIFNPDNIDHGNQLNTYAWLYRKAGFEVEGLRIVAILRDWQKSKALKDVSYPQIPISVKSVKLWSENDQWKYIGQRLQLHKEAQALLDDEIPICSPEERWQSEDTWAVYKGENIRALRVLEKEKEAIDFVDIYLKQYSKVKLRTEKREGIAKRCQDYCSVNKWCNYFKTSQLDKEE